MVAQKQDIYVAIQNKCHCDQWKVLAVTSPISIRKLIDRPPLDKFILVTNAVHKTNAMPLYCAHQLILAL